jgi:23S rRNA pseudouridine955/2504/2580 synthase
MSPDAPDEKPSVRYVTVGAESAGQRVDNFLRTELKGAPKSLVYRILRTGEVRINKGRAKPETRIAEGDVVRIPPLRLSEQAPQRVGTALAETLKAAILYEDDAMLVLNKPAGLAVHAGSGVNMGVIEALRLIYPSYPGLELAHRIDRETSGVLVLAKDRPTLLTLHAWFRDDAVQKTYLALVHGAFPEDLAEVDAPLEKNTLRSGERLVEVRDDGKPSITRFRVLSRFGSRPEPGASTLGASTLIEARPLTGRTHQIRVHAAYAGYPLVGDAKYGVPERDRALKASLPAGARSDRLGSVRLFLHAVRIVLPASGAPGAGRGTKKELRIEAPLPDDLTRLLSMLEGPDDDAG